MNDDHRIGHLVGSIPAADGESAMKLAHDTLGDHLRWLPDGETGERTNWVMNIVEGLRAHPDLEIAQDGDWSGYDKTPRFKIRKGHTLKGESLDFGHVAAFQESYPIFQRLKESSGNPELIFQVGIPGVVDMAGIVGGPGAVFRHRKPFHDATVSEVRRIHELGGEDVLFQLEVPFELVFVARAPRGMRAMVARMMGKAVARIAADAPAGTRYGIHLCLGDMNHESLVDMKDMTPVVTTSNAIVAAWPSGRPLEFIHAPFSGASQAPTLDPAFYAPLAKLNVPSGTRFIAGFAYEHQSLGEQATLLGIIESAAGRRVDISTSCGLGRRSLEEASAAIQRTRELAEL